jgi:hypothetical protein
LGGRFDTCWISQNIQTNAVPRPTTTPRKTNVRAGAVSMVNIPYIMQAAYQQATYQQVLYSK